VGSLNEGASPAAHLLRRADPNSRLTVESILLALLVCAVWGVSVAISKIGVAQFPPLFLLAIRFSIVAALIVPFAPVPWGSMTRLVWLSLTLGILHFSAMFVGLTMIDTSSAVILQQLQVPFAVVLAYLAFGERPGPIRLMGIIVAFVGVCVAFSDASGRLSGTGVGLMIAAAFFWAMGSLQMKALKRTAPIVAIGWTSLLAAPWLFLASGLMETGQLQAVMHVNETGLLCIGYLSFGTTLLGYALWYRLLSRHSISSVAPFTLLIPAFGMFAGSLLLGDRLSMPFVAGSAITLMGIALVLSNDWLSSASH